MHLTYFLAEKQQIGFFQRQKNGTSSFEYSKYDTASVRQNLLNQIKSAFLKH